ncbi:hypothetical protein DL93DRAFT_2172874 [Clavulina sp. PMI_390]|nr:hypothetical protein DL93DRAFT_2172874 [Clavulina sp. PMI_390]
MSVLAKGAACLRCRKLKEKCDGLKPTCTRCRKRPNECIYPTGIARRAPISGTLQARALELEMIIHKLTVASTHDLSLASARLLDRIGRLGNAVPAKHPLVSTATAWLPIYPYSQHRKTEQKRGQIVSQDVTEGYASIIERSVVEQKLHSFQWGKLGERDAPPSLSLQLVSLFLPYRAHYYFFMDVPHLLHCVSLPPSHPDAIHPCLLNACYLGACASSGGTLTSLEPYFIRRTRYFLDQSLKHADRITHFLWASIILTCYFAKARRLDESFAVANAATHFAYACGLSPSGDPTFNGTKDFDVAGYLLPPPKDETEAINRIRLAHSLYLLDQTAPILGGVSTSFPYDPSWASTPKKASHKYQYGEGMSVREERLSEIWHSDMHLKVSMARNFDRVTALARHASGAGYRELDEEYSSLKVHLDSEHSAIPPLSDPVGLQSSEAVGMFNPNLLLVHITLYGSGLILHSLQADKDSEARKRLRYCVESLMDVCQKVRGNKRLRKVQSGLMNAAHMMNAVRVVAHELKRSGARGRNAKLLTSNCHAIEVFLDFLDDVTMLNPAWTETPLLLKDALTAAVTPLVSKTSQPVK